MKNTTKYNSANSNDAQYIKALLAELAGIKSQIANLQEQHNTGMATLKQTLIDAGMHDCLSVNMPRIYRHIK